MAVMSGVVLERAAPSALFLALACSAASCAGGGARSAPSDRLEAAVGSAGELDLLDAALIASGITERARISGARADLERLLGGAVDHLKSVANPAERGRLLLAALHAKGGLLAEYDTRATTLADVLERRRYNCVSSAVLYNVFAERLDLEVSAQLLPTHARSIVRAGSPASRRIIVETTSPNGFDPDPEQERAILASVAGREVDGARSLVPEEGAIVDTRVLIGTIYVNRASIAQEHGDLELAERLFARGESFAGDEAMRGVLRDQRAALLAQLAADDVLSEDPSRLLRAFRTLKAAIALSPRDPAIRATVSRNLRASAERLIHREAEAGREAAVLAIAGEAVSLPVHADDRSGLLAFALSEAARLRLGREDFGGALDALDAALREQLSPSDGDLRATLEENRVSALRMAAFTRARRGDYAAAVGFLDRLDALPELTGALRREVRKDRLRAIHIAGSERIEKGDFAGAAEIYREGVRHFPSDETSRNNLVAALERLAMPLVESGRCEEAKERLEEVRAIHPASRFPERATVRCLTERGRARLLARDYSEAVSLLGAAHDASPGDRAVAENLAEALIAWLAALSSERRCGDLERLVHQIRRLPRSDRREKAIRAALGPCGR